MAKLLTNEQVDKYWRDGYVHPLRALSEADAQSLRNRIEAFEAEQACEAQQALVFKAHLPFRWLSDIITHPLILDAVEDVIGPTCCAGGPASFKRTLMTRASFRGTRTPIIMGWSRQRR